MVEDWESWLDQPSLARIWAKSFPVYDLWSAKNDFSPKAREEAKLTRISFFAPAYFSNAIANPGLNVGFPSITG